MKSVIKNEQSYYEDLMTYSRENLMLYPYHLSDVIVKGLRITPFQFYISTIIHVMESDKSYDSIPNFTAVDCNYLSDEQFLLKDYFKHSINTKDI